MPEIIPNWHPIFVHFTVALFSLAAGLFVITPFVKPPLQEQWRIVARWALWFGAGITVITGLTGLYAYNTVAHDTPSHAAMTEHRNWAIVTITLFLSLAIWSVLRVRRQQALGVAFVGLMVVGGGLLGSTAWHGGEVVYRYGLGVMSLPKKDTHEHAGADHAHDTGEMVQGVEEPHHDDGHAHDAEPEEGHSTGDEMMMRDEAPARVVSDRNAHHDDDHDQPHDH